MSKRQRVAEGEAKVEPHWQGEGETKEARSRDSDVDDVYFDSYDDLSVHALMLSDEARVGAYVAAIRMHRDALKGRVVLDLGAGSGVLSLVAAKHGGASKVYAIEAAPALARLAEALAERNGLSDVVHVIQGRAEDVELPEMVDAIVSEWMGFYLVHESMLESVFAARDRWLKPGGAMLPDCARIWAALVDAEDLRCEVEAYSDLHGLDLGPVGDYQLARRCREPQIEMVKPTRLLTSAALAVDLGDLRVRPKGSTAEMSAEVRFTALRSGRVAGVSVWFDVAFSQDSRTGEAVVLSTAPGAPPTHWKQTVVYLGAFVPVQAGDMLPVRLKFKQSAENARQYDITVETI